MAIVYVAPQPACVLNHLAHEQERGPSSTLLAHRGAACGLISTEGRLLGGGRPSSKGVNVSVLAVAIALLKFIHGELGPEIRVHTIQHVLAGKLNSDGILVP